MTICINQTKNHPPTLNGRLFSLDLVEAAHEETSCDWVHLRTLIFHIKIISLNDKKGQAGQRQGSLFLLALRSQHQEDHR